MVGESQGKYVVVPAFVRSELVYWASLKAWQSSMICVRDTASWLAQSDASMLGWGVVLTHLPSGRVWRWNGYWPMPLRSRHITELELLAGERGLAGLEQLGVREEVVRWQTDSVATKAALNKLRSRSSRLDRVAKRVARMLQRTGVVVRAEHIRGVENPADYDSRGGLKLLVDHRVRKDIFRVVNFLRPHSIDAFASRSSAMLRHYFSKWPDPRAIGTDAFRQRWGGAGPLWMHPPWSDIQLVLDKWKADPSAAVTLFLPKWQTASWWTHLWEVADEIWLLPKAGVMVHAESNRIMPPIRTLLAFLGPTPVTSSGRHSWAINELGRRLHGQPIIWEKVKGVWTQRSSDRR